MFRTDAPLSHVLLLEQLLLPLSQIGILSGVPLQRFVSEPVGLLEGFRFLASILEPGGQILVNQFARLEGVVAIPNHKV